MLLTLPLSRSNYLAVILPSTWKWPWINSLSGVQAWLYYVPYIYPLLYIHYWGTYKWSNIPLDNTCTDYREARTPHFFWRLQHWKVSKDRQSYVDRDIPWSWWWYHWSIKDAFWCKCRYSGKLGKVCMCCLLPDGNPNRKHSRIKMTPLCKYLA